MRSRRCWVEICPEALEHNLDVVKRLAGEGTGVVAVVKANAYGHGARLVAPRLAGKVAMLAVACLDEAREARALAPDTPVLLLGPSLPEERAAVVAEGFIPVVSDLEEARAFAALGTTERPAVAHLVVDTGMGRIGVWEEEAAALCREVARLRSLRVTGIASHLPCADEDEAFTREQIARFNALADSLRREFFAQDPPVRHLLNSAGILRRWGGAGDLVRAGLMLYGVSPLPEMAGLLRPVMAWKSRVTLVRRIGAGRGISYGRTFVSQRPMRVATISAGYADGYHRTLSNRGAEVLIRGRRCAVLGRVTMDQIVADVSGFEEREAPEPGEEVVLMGRQGGGEVSAAELAEKAGTIPWEILTSAGNGARGGRFLASDAAPGG